MKIHNCTQGSSEWKQLRVGIPTASEFDRLISPLWKPRTGAGPTNYVYEKIAEKVMGYAPDCGSSFAMDQGSLLENEAVPMYEGVYDVKVQRVGFCTTDDGRIGCSPDGLIGEDGGLEVKCPEPHTHLEWIAAGVLPKEHAAQVHGSMFVTGRPRWTFLSYSRWFAPLVIQVERDPLIQEAIHGVLTDFLADYDAALLKVQSKIQQRGRAA